MFLHSIVFFFYRLRQLTLGGCNLISLIANAVINGYFLILKHNYVLYMVGQTIPFVHIYSFP